MGDQLVITTLTCNDRETIFPTISSFLEGTTLPEQGLRWYLLIQGASSAFLDKLKLQLDQWQRDYAGIVFRCLVYKDNLGLSKGMNLLDQAVKDYSYVLLLEDDWILLSPEVTGLDKNWLVHCWNFMKNQPEVATLFLRKYRNPEEEWQYGWTRSIPYRNLGPNEFNYQAKMKDQPEINFESLTLKRIPEFLFTFNPTLRSNRIYEQHGVYPVAEFPDIRSERESWGSTQEQDVPYFGWAEALNFVKTKPLMTYYVGRGLFGHYDHWKEMI